MKCKVFKNKEGSEVLSFDGSPQEMREYFGKSFSAEVDVVIPGSDVKVTGKGKRKKSSESREDMLVRMANLRARKGKVSSTRPGNVFKTALKKIPKKYLLRNKKYWTPEEDALLLAEVNAYGGGSQAVFKLIEAKIVGRTWKSCENRYYKLATGQVTSEAYKTTTIGTATVRKKRSKKYNAWIPEHDRLLEVFVTDPSNYFVNGYVKKSKQKLLSRNVGHTVAAVKARCHAKGLGRKADIDAMLAKGKHAQGVILVAAADKHTEQKIVDDLTQEPEHSEFPVLNNADVQKSSYVNTFKYFTAVKGNNINLKDAFPLFGVKSVEQWDKLLHEIISKGPSICASLGLGNTSFKIVTGEHGRVLQFG